MHKVHSFYFGVVDLSMYMQEFYRKSSKSRPTSFSNRYEKNFAHLNEIAVAIDEDRKYTAENTTVCVVASRKSLEKVTRRHFGHLGGNKMISGI